MDDPNLVCGRAEIPKRLRADRIGFVQYPVHIVNVSSVSDRKSKELKGLGPRRKGANVLGKFAFGSHWNLYDAAMTD